MMSDIVDGEQHRKENLQEYARLLGDQYYERVSFDEESGGLSAVHKNHRLDKQLGIYGKKRGEYELEAIDTIRRKGHSIVLIAESTDVGQKQYDGLLDGIPCEIKAVEKMGRWTVRTKIANAAKQGANTVVLYFPNESLFSEQRVREGWRDYCSYAKESDYNSIIKVLCVAGGGIYQIEKPSW